MKIALIRKVFNADGGGAERVAANFVKEFVKKGHRITVYSEKFKGETSEAVEWVKVPKSVFSFISSTYFFHREAQRMLKDRTFDIVYSMCRTYPADVLRVTEQVHAEWMPIGYGRFAGCLPRHRLILELEKKIFLTSNTRHVVTNSNLVKRQIAARFSYPGKNISVVRNGVDRNIYSPAENEEERKKLRSGLGISPRKNILLFVAANFRIKGLDAAIKALSGVRPDLRSNTVIYVIGGDESMPYQKLARKLSIGENVCFAGRRKNVRDFYAASDLLFYPSLYEPFANVCLEACACALPVMTTEQNGSSEMIQDGVNGYLVKDAGCVKDMTARLNDFLEMDNDARRNMAMAAYEASKSYDWGRHVDELENIFEKVAREKAGL